MKRYHQYTLMSLLIAVMLTGCQLPQPSNAPTPTPPTATAAPVPAAATRESSDPTRFQNPSQGQSALDSAIELSKKFAALSEEMAELQKEKEQLAMENQRP